MVYSPRAQPTAPQWRLSLLLGLLSVAAVVLAGVAIRLQLVDHSFLADKGERSSLRVVPIPAHRAMITDRYNEPLAVSTPVESVWVNPRKLAEESARLPELEQLLKLPRGELARKVNANLDRGFLVLARGLQPTESNRVRALGISSVNLVQEDRRYYPAGEVTAHVLGLTSTAGVGLVGVGLQGLELALDSQLAGEAGVKRVLQDATGRKVEDVASIRSVLPGQSQTLSIDLRLQYLAYRALKSAVSASGAKGGSLIVIDVRTGEVLAMVNQPGFNPNDRQSITPGVDVNRAVTDPREPGSIIKPFFVAAALASGRYGADSIVDTGNGAMMVGATAVTDEHSIGAASLATILAKSSNVGMAKIALALEPVQIWKTLTAFGFGQATGSSLPNESPGLLSNYTHWRNVVVANMSHGYSLMVTPLQLAHAYATIGAYGVRHDITLQRVDGAAPGQQMVDAAACRTLIGLLEAVTTDEGATGKRAQIPGYRVAGKTGTAWKVSGGAYAKDRFVSSFGGIVPASAPRLAAVVVIDEPSGAGFLHQGGGVAAPVFAEVMGGALRLLGIPPDAPASDVAPERLPPRRVAQR